MAAYLIAFVKVKDPGKLQEYSSQAGPTLAAAGGTVVGRGKVKGLLAGSFDADSCLIAKFASVDAAHAWYNSPAYQALVAVRDQAMIPTFMLIEEPN